MSERIDISFRKLEEADLFKLHRWLNMDFVVKWYGKKPRSYVEVVKRFLPRIKGEVPTHSFIIVCRGTDIGYIQTYAINDYPEYSRYVQVDEEAAGLDLFIGEGAYIHQGLGKNIINKFLREYVFTLTNCRSCVICPEPKNKAAIKTYEKVGFKYLKTIQVPGEDEPEYLMRIELDDILESFCNDKFDCNTVSKTGVS